MQHLLGAFPHSGLLRAPATLDQMKRARSWQVAFLGRDRDARCPTRNAAPASETSRPSHSPGCQIAPVASAESRRGSRCLEVLRVAKAAV